jgi:predicted AlkP superfamily pyrophosphatase or phosphodiesterase
MHRGFCRTGLQLIALLVLAAAQLQRCIAAPVLMISIDGLKPEYVIEADARGLKIPFLRSLMRDGVYAGGVVGAWPTVTYPNHTTLITGVSPAEHGIYNNQQFDPERQFTGAWHWYAAQIRVPTLWKAAHDAGLRTASVGWPVSVGATDVDFLIPEYWRAPGASGSKNPSDRELIAALSRPDTLLRQLAPVVGPYMMGNDTSIDGDEIKTRYSVEILRREKPQLTTIHLSSLDAAQHESGPFSPEADRDLEALDSKVARLADAARANDPSAVVAVVSDHGFLALTHTVNLYIPFLQAGLIQATVNPVTKAPAITSWKAQPWLAGGMAAIMLYDSADRETEEQVHQLLDKLAADPDNGIAAVLDRAAILQHGGFPDAAFLVVLKPGYTTGTATTGDLVNVGSVEKGGHGFSAEYPEMHASLFMAGAGIAHHRDLGVIDMRQIAPTVANILGVPMPSAKAERLNILP